MEKKSLRQRLDRGRRGWIFITICSLFILISLIVIVRIHWPEDHIVFQYGWLEINQGMVLGAIGIGVAYIIASWRLFQTMLVAFIVLVWYGAKINIVVPDIIGVPLLLLFIGGPFFLAYLLIPSPEEYDRY